MLVSSHTERGTKLKNMPKTHEIHTSRGEADEVAQTLKHKSVYEHLSHQIHSDIKKQKKQSCRKRKAWGFELHHMKRHDVFD